MLKRGKGRSVRPERAGSGRRIDHEESPEMGLIQKALQRRGFLAEGHDTNKWDELTQWAWEEACSANSELHLIKMRPGKANAPEWLAKEIAIIEEVAVEEVVVEVPVVTTSNPSIVPMDPEVEAAEVAKALMESTSANFDYVPPPPPEAPVVEEVLPEVPPVVNEDDFELDEGGPVESVEDALKRPNEPVEIPSSLAGEDIDSESLVDEDDPTITFEAEEPPVLTESIGKKVDIKK